MSTLVAQTISNGTVSTSSANVIQGSAKAWARFTGSTGAIEGSFNVSSITRNAAGDYTVNFTTAMPNANYATVANCPYIAGVALTIAATNWSVISGTYVTPTTTAYRIAVTSTSSTTGYDPNFISTAAFSS